MGLAAASFSQIADAMGKIKQQLDATPPPSDALKQSLLAAYQNLNDALGDIALDDYATAADSVGDAAKNSNLSGSSTWETLPEDEGDKKGKK